MFHKGKLGYDCLGEAAENRTHWLDCGMAKWNLARKCSNEGTTVHMTRMRARKASRI
jgi:hypothetical protein